VDVFRLLSFYYTSVGFFVNQTVLLASIHVLLYAKLYFSYSATSTADSEGELP
jgi:hypothetical protein